MKRCKRPSARVSSLAVAPHAGAWIETLDKMLDDAMNEGRPPCGGVD